MHNAHLFTSQASSMQEKYTKPTPVFDLEKYRLLCLTGDMGTVATRIHGAITSATIPRLSKEWTVESATRSLLRMKNLCAVRGTAGDSMVGPADYYGNLEKPDQVLYTVGIKDGVPQMFQHPVNTPLLNQNFLKTKLKKDYVTTVRAKWISGTDKKIDELRKSYKGTKKGESLFPNLGLLEIEAGAELKLPFFDATTADLSSFKARLVSNITPFSITSKKLPASDEYRAVSFLYEPGYSNSQVKNGGGLFLETHSFAQTMMPLDKNSKGFVVLGRWTDEKKNNLELIAIHIPFGFTLIIDEGCIHGDATLNGMFMMCMTSNHVTMQTADSVFLKSTETRDNLSLVVASTSSQQNYIEEKAPRPFVFYKDNPASKASYLNETYGKNFIANPTSPGWRDTAMHNSLSTATSIFHTSSTKGQDDKDTSDMQENSSCILS